MSTLVPIGAGLLGVGGSAARGLRALIPNANSGDVESVTRRDQLLDSAHNDKLRNAINEIYRSNAKVGDGGLADAVRHELRTGELAGGKSHIIKAQERIRNLENIIRSQSLNRQDLRIAYELLYDLKNALRMAK